MGQKFNAPSLQIYRYRRLILTVWFLLLTVCGIYLWQRTTPLAEIELSGAQGTEADQVQRILTKDFHYKLGGSAALVMPVDTPHAALVRSLTERFPEIQRIDRVTTERVHQWKLLKIAFSPDYALTYLSQHTADLRAHIDRWKQTQKVPADIFVTGSTAFQYDTRVESKKDARRSESMALLLSLAVLILTFGSLLSACLPLLMGASCVMFFYGVIGLVGGSVSPVSRILVSLVGLALSIDYALFLVSRFKEERALHEPAQAWKNTLIHTGKTVLFSGLIMLCSLSALLIPDVSLSRSLMVHLMLVIGLAMFHALLILPLLLVVGARYLAWPGFLVRWIQQRALQSKTFWRRFSQHVVYRARFYFVVSLSLLALLIWPLTDFKIWSPVNAIAPQSSSSMQAYRLLQADGWEGELLPVIVAYRHQNVFAPEALEELHTIHNALVKHPAVYRVQSLVGSEPVSSYQSLYNSLQAIGFWGAPEALRQLVIPEQPTQTLMYIFPKDTRSPVDHAAIVDALHGQRDNLQGELLVGGVVARVNDFTHELYRQLPLMLALIVGGVLLLLGLHLRSVVLPVKAALINFAPILGAFGTLVLVFQWGWGQTFLHASVNGAITNTVPLILFCLVFGLSMDYEVLMISRMHEHYLDHGEVKPAIIEGLATSGALITGAVLILMGVFVPGCFSSSSQTQEICIGIVSAMLIDATVVRLFLVPSFMTLMGRWNWWPHHR